MSFGKGRNLLVTGASRGIGAAIARAAAAEGWNVALNYVSRRQEADALAAELVSRGVRAITVAADISDPAEVARLYAECDARLGRLDDVVINAGITGRAGRLESAADSEIVRAIAVDLTGAIWTARGAIARLSTRHGGRGGSIVAISSAAARLGAPGDFVWYAAAKGGVESLVAGLAVELGDDGIRVNAVQPGLIETEIHETAGLGGRLERLAPSVPLRRFGTAAEVADATIYLMSPRAAYVTGAVLKVTGGR